MSESTNATREEYLTHIEKQKSSGLSVRVYCEQNNLDDQKFGYYKSYKLKPTGSSSFVKAKINNVQAIAKVNTKIDPQWLAQFINNLILK